MKVEVLAILSLVTCTAAMVFTAVVIRIADKRYDQLIERARNAEHEAVKWEALARLSGYKVKSHE